MKVIFMGTPAFAVPALQALVNTPSFEITAVFTQAPKQRGRNLHIVKSEVHQLAESYRLNVLTPTSLKNAEIQDVIRSYTPDVIVVVAYGFIIPQAILAMPKYGCINIHPSLLPRHRGAAPIQHTILSGDKESAVCIMRMDEGVDTGDILKQGKFPLSSDVTAQELHDKCAALGAELLISTLSDIENITPSKQSIEGATYAHKITKQDGKINWQNMDAGTIERMVRAFTPWPGVTFAYRNEEIKLLGCEVITQNSSDIKPGTVLDNRLTIQTRNGCLKITLLQKPGKKIISAEEFLRGTVIKLGEILG